MSRKSLGICCGVLLTLGLVALAPAARADEFDQATQFTFSQAIQLPGNRVLPAGTYWFVLQNPISAPNVVQVFDVNRTNLLATVMTDPTIRYQRSDDGVVTLAEQGKQRPDALLDWYYPDRVTGHEFVYSTRMANKLDEEPHVTIMAKTVPEIHESAQASTRGATYAAALHYDDAAFRK